MRIQSKEIRYAKFAKEQLCSNSIKMDKEFISLIKGLPGQFSQNGLIQTLAFYKAKTEEKYKSIPKIIDNFFNDVLNKKSNNNFLLEYLLKELDDIHDYNYYQQEIIDFSIALKRVSSALFAQNNNKG